MKQRVFILGVPLRVGLSAAIFSGLRSAALRAVLKRISAAIPHATPKLAGKSQEAKAGSTDL